MTSVACVGIGNSFIWQFKRSTPKKSLHADKDPHFIVKLRIKNTF